METKASLGGEEVQLPLVSFEAELDRQIFSRHLIGFSINSTDSQQH
jgi:hypothetical protein